MWKEFIKLPILKAAETKTISIEVKMKKVLYISIVLVIAVVTLFAYNFIGSKDELQSGKLPVQEINEENSSCCASEKEAGEYTDYSIYQLGSEWVNQSGEKVNLADFRGKKVVMTMFFATCTYACPILVEDMKRIDSAIPEKDRENYKFVLISIDPERDTPASLNEFAKMKVLDESKWQLLTGSEESILELAALIGFKYKKESDGQFSHSNIINILNEEGEIEFQHQGLNQDVKLAANYLRN
jgi:protein SCO1